MRSPSTSTPVIIALGDSITQFGADPNTKGFLSLLSQDYVRKADVINRGLSGWTTRWWVQYIPQLIAEWQSRPPVILFIALGANDASLPNGESAMRHVPLEEYKVNLISITHMILDAFPKCKLFFITPPAVDNSKWNPKDKLNQVTLKYAKACIQVAVLVGFPVIDAWTAVEGHWELLRDGLHPNTEGNILFHQLIQNLIEKNFPHLTPHALPEVYPDIPPQPTLAAYPAHIPSKTFVGRLVSVKSPTRSLRLQPNDSTCHLWTTGSARCIEHEWIFDGRLIRSNKFPSKCIHVQNGPSRNRNAMFLDDVAPGSYPCQEWIFDGRLIRSVKDLAKCVHLFSGWETPAVDGDGCHLWDIIEAAYPAQEWVIEWISHGD